MENTDMISRFRFCGFLKELIFLLNVMYKRFENPVRNNNNNNNNNNNECANYSNNSHNWIVK
jgi:hypothetical protein